LAKAEASAATVSMDRCMGGLRRKDVKAYRDRFRALDTPTPWPTAYDDG